MRSCIFAYIKIYVYHLVAAYISIRKTNQLNHQSSTPTGVRQAHWLNSDRTMHGIARMFLKNSKALQANFYGQDTLSNTVRKTVDSLNPPFKHQLTIENLTCTFGEQTKRQILERWSLATPFFHFQILSSYLVRFFVGEELHMERKFENNSWFLPSIVFCFPHLTRNIPILRYFASINVRRSHGSRSSDFANLLLDNWPKQHHFRKQIEYVCWCIPTVSYLDRDGSNSMEWSTFIKWRIIDGKTINYYI